MLPLKGEGGVSAQQQFDFFTRTVWTPEPSDDEEQDKENVPGQEGDGDGEKDVDTQEPEGEAEVWKGRGVRGRMGLESRVF